jgi:hypothetical protein
MAGPPLVETAATLLVLMPLVKLPAALLGPDETLVIAPRGMLPALARNTSASASRGP